MQIDTGKISLIQMEPNGERTAQIGCQPKLFPRPGQYLQAYNPDEPDSALGWALFPVGTPSSIDDPKSSAPLSLGPIPRTWHPGSTLELRGPLGHGFDLPAASHLALVVLGKSALRLLPLIHPALENNTDIAIFSATPLPPLPAAVEIHPLSALPEALAWADFTALDLTSEKLPALRKIFGLDPLDYLPCPAQVLITIPMPCAGIGECGACAVATRRKGYRLACKDGPVFNLNQLEW